MPRPGKKRRAEGDTASCGPILDLNSHIATKVAVFANRLSRSASRYYRKRYGIGVVDWRLVMFIGHAVETRANRICSQTGLDKGAVSRSLNTLQRRGLISVEEDGIDNRRNNITLTAKGRTLHDEMVPVALDRQSDLVADLTKVEIDLFTALIDRMQARVVDGEPLPDEPLATVPLAAVPPPERPPRRGKSPGRQRQDRRR
ncbi:MAG TPA: MarR family winged helix-turn-helix transcriptional regulator [Hyphomicrobiaceae bacterium]|nr:MarR family winged helix-turn-helix transcriptional regulator [Hyphomicrobiaceae bacterium]